MAVAANCTVIVVTYNSARTIAACLSSIDPRAATIVIDNASSDATASIVTRDFPGTQLIRSQGNTGFGAAVNRAAASCSRGWILLLNPDAQLGVGCLDAMLDHAAAHPALGIYGAFAAFPDGRPTRLSGFNDATLWSVLLTAIGLRAVFPGYRWSEPEVIDEPRSAAGPGVPVGYVSGACLLIATSLWRDLGGFDPLYFMYGEDADLCLRARQLGYLPTLVPSARIVHEVGGSTETWASRQIQLLAGRITLLRRHWPPIERRLVTPIFLTHVFWRLLATSLVAPFSAEVANRRRGWRTVWQARGDWSRGYLRATDGVTANRGQLPSMREADTD